MKTTASIDKLAGFSDKENTPFVWRMLKPEDAMPAYQLHLAANTETPPGLVRSDDLAHFVANIQDQGRILGCFVNGKGMVAYGILGMEPASNSKIIRLLNLPEAELANFASLDGAAALAPWRGNRLHRESIQARLEIGRAQHRRYIGATVSPENINSLRGLLEAGFYIKNFAHLYGGLARLVMLLDLDASPATWTLRGAVIASDQAGHQAALAKGWFGFELSKTGASACQVLYGVQD